MILGIKIWIVHYPLEHIQKEIRLAVLCYKQYFVKEECVGSIITSRAQLICKGCAAKKGAAILVQDGGPSFEGLTP